jgi:hypothetical protein
MSFFEVAPEIIGFLMIGAMLFAIFIGFPISFTLIFLGIVFGAWGFGMKLTIFLMTLQFYGSMMEQTLAAVPLFVFMGFMMEQAGLMERLFKAVQLMLARMTGSLFVAVLFVSVVFGAATGIVGASVTILGIMAAKTMSESGYDVRLAAGTITAGGTLGILIPPSIMLVVMGPVLEVPVTDLFAGAILPGVMMAVLYLVYALGRCWLNPKLGPPLREDQIPEDRSHVWREFILGLVPPTILIENDHRRGLCQSASDARHRTRVRHYRLGHLCRFPILFPKAGITFWDVGHEGNAGMMADGFTRASGKMSMMIAQNGPASPTLSPRSRPPTGTTPRCCWSPPRRPT